MKKEKKFDDFDKWFAEQVKNHKADEDEYTIASAAWEAGFEAGGGGKASYEG